MCCSGARLVQVRTEHGVEGWASQQDMLKTVLADGSPFRFSLGDRAGFTAHRFELACCRAVRRCDAGFRLRLAVVHSQLALEGALGQFLGKFSNGVSGDVGLTHVIAPEARWSPFLMLGLGLVHVEPKQL